MIQVLAFLEQRDKILVKPVSPNSLSGNSEAKIDWYLNLGERVFFTANLLCMSSVVKNWSSEGRVVVQS